jgi:uncharacterized protein YaaQ
VTSATNTAPTEGKLRLLFVVVQRDDLEPLLAALRTRGYGVTILESAGGFLRRASVTLLLAVEDWQVRVVIRLLREHCHTREEFAVPPGAGFEGLPFAPIPIAVGGAVLFALRLARIERLGLVGAPGQPLPAQRR